MRTKKSCLKWCILMNAWKERKITQVCDSAQTFGKYAHAICEDTLCPFHGYLQLSRPLDIVTCVIVFSEAISVLNRRRNLTCNVIVWGCMRYVAKLLMLSRMVWRHDSASFWTVHHTGAVVIFHGCWSEGPGFDAGRCGHFQWVVMRASSL